jgi:type I restriction enzyme S subunit
MELKPGYKQTEVGVIPEDWEVHPFSELLDFRNGVNADKHAYGKGVPLFNVLEVITKAHLRKSDIPGRVSIARGVVDSYAVRRGDLLFNRTSETQEEVGLSSVYLDEETVVFGGFVIRGRPTNASIDATYSGYAFRAPAIRSQITAKGQGAIRANIGQADLRQVLVPLPPLPEQRAIAGVLGDVDALVGALEKLIAKKRDLKQAVMQQFLTGQQRLPGFSGEWEVKRFADLFQFLNTANNPRADLSGFGDVGYIHYGDIHTTAAAFLDCAEAALPLIARTKVANISQVEDGDLVMADASEDYDGIGKSLEIRNVKDYQIVAGLHTFLLRGDRNLIADGFKGYLQFIPSVKAALVRLATGISVYGVSKGSVKNIEVLLPGVKEQTAIAALLSDMDAEISAREARLAKTRAIKQGMMQELLTGRVRLV